MKLSIFRRELGLSQFELVDLAKVQRHKLQLAERGIAILTEEEANRVAKVLGLKMPIPKWLEELVSKDLAF